MYILVSHSKFIKMDRLEEDLDDSALQCMTLVQKRKVSTLNNPKNSKQLKLSFSQKDISCKSDEEKDTRRPTKSQSYDLNESSSSYFGIKKSINTCPLCLKTFENDSNYLTHMKQCAKKRKMTTQQLLGALELQKKQIEERRAFGLCSQLVSSNKKSFKKTTTNSKTDCDLALGIALSKSLETETKASTQNSDALPTLETFGFTASTSRTNPVKKRGKSNKKSVLRERTQEERQRIVTEKAAVVLLDEEGEESQPIADNHGKKYLIRNAEIQKYHNKVSYLWGLAENEESTTWYVEEIKQRMQLPYSLEEINRPRTPEIEEEVEEKNLLEEPADEECPTKNEELKHQEVEEESHQIKSVDEGKIVEVEKEKVDEDEEKHTSQFTPSPEENIAEQISKLKLPKNNIYQDWKKMINNEKFSDITGTTKDLKSYYLHSLVFCARCPQILEQDIVQIFRKYTLTAILIFLEYVYCGTLYSLSRTELGHLLNLAISLNYIELINVLKDLESSLTESSEGMIPSSLTPEREKDVTLIENIKEPDLTVVPEDIDMFVDDMVDLTQSSHGSTTIVDGCVNEEPGNDSLEGKSYWSILHQEEKRKKEEEKENSEISMEMEKIETSMKKQQELMKLILEEYKEDETNALERQKIYELQKRESYDFENKNTDDDRKTGEEEKASDDCIILSSDSETKQSKSSPLETRDFDYEIPHFDPYENYNPFSPIRSQSFITGDVSFGHDSPQKKEGMNKELSPEYCSTPILKPLRTSPTSTASESVPQTPSIRSKNRKRKSDLSANRIIRKSLGLKVRNSSKSAKKTKEKEGKELAEAITNSILEELSTTPLFKSSPLQSQKFVEMTPMGSRDIEFGEAVTPSPNYSNMGESVIKEQLAKYGLKRSLGKSKAKKILRYIYEELHPLLNTETGKLVRKLPSDTPKPRKKGKPKEKGCKKNKKAEESKKPSGTRRKKVTDGSPKLNSTKDSDLVSNGSVCSLDKSTDYDSEGSEFENLSEPLTQSAATNAVDLPSALSEFLLQNPEFHQKILLYEPIWLEDLQKSLKETFKKHFKLSDLMDYLDQKCITFRSAAQKKNNEKQNEKRRNSPRKKKKSS